MNLWHAGDASQSVPFLARPDVDRLLGALQSLDRQFTLDAFPSIATKAVLKAIPGISASYTEVDPRGKQSNGVVSPTDHTPTPALLEVFNVHFAQHPLITNPDRAHHSEVEMISDFLPERRYHELELYGDFYRRLDTEDQLVMQVPLPGRVAGLVVNRDRRSFTEVDRFLLGAMRPHLLQARRRAEVFTMLEAALERGSQELIWLTRTSRIRRATELAPQLLEMYFGGHHRPATRLPAPLEDWLRVSRERSLDDQGDFWPPEALTVTGLDGRLIVRFFSSTSGESDFITLTEERSTPSIDMLSALGLTRRECEVLLLVIRGKTSAELGEILGLRRRTAEKHLEHIYHKLGVNTRAELVAYVLQSTARPR